MRASFALAGLTAVLWAAPALAQAPAGGADVRAVLEALNRDDAAEARRRAEAAAAAGDPEAQNALATLLQAGAGGPADPQRALKLLEAAGAAGSPTATLNLGVWLAQEPNPQAQARAVELLQAALNDPRTTRAALYPLGRMLLLGRGAPQDLEAGSDLIEQSLAFDPGNADANYLMGQAHRHGWGNRLPDRAQARVWYLKAAELGSPEAIAILTEDRLDEAN